MKFDTSTDPLRGSYCVRIAIPSCAQSLCDFGSVEKLWGMDYALLPNREWSQKQKHKKQPWGNVECFAFGGATVRFASLETSFHAANLPIPPPPSCEGCPLCQKAVFYVFLFQCPQHLSTEPRFSLAWCFASFGIFDACLGCCFQEVKKLRRYLCLW